MLPEAGLDLTQHLRDTERSLIRSSLERTGGNKQQAARLLNIKRTTLLEKAKRLGLEGEIGNKGQETGDR